MTSLIVVVDADNTLWDTDAVFATAQLSLLKNVEGVVDQVLDVTDRLAFVRSYDQALAERHHAHLRYPPQLLARALAVGIRGREPDFAAADLVAGRDVGELPQSFDLEQALDDYVIRLRTVPRLLPTARDALLLARQCHIPVYVMTEGRVEKQQQLIRKKRLSQAVAGVWEMTKDVSQFKRVRQRFSPANVFVLGDQPTRDIAPAHTAGCLTVLVPSRFQPMWKSTGQSVLPTFVARTLLEGMQWVVAHRGTVAW